MKIKMDDERHKEEFDEVRKECPWKDMVKGIPSTFQGRCKAFSSPCIQENCALLYFKIFFERRSK